MSLYEQVGGEAIIARVTADFYARISSHDLLGRWFADADGDRIETHLRTYLTVALGGPEGYTGRSMRKAHAGLHITGTAFDLVLGSFAEALSAAAIDPAITARVVAVIAALRPVVVEIL